MTAPLEVLSRCDLGSSSRRSKLPGSMIGGTTGDNYNKINRASTTLNLKSYDELSDHLYGVKKLNVSCSRRTSICHKEVTSDKYA